VVPKEERANYVKPDFLKRLEPLEPVRFLAGLKSQVRIQIVDDETSTTKAALDKLVAAAPATAKTLHYPSGRAMYAANSGGRLFEWTATALKSLPQTQAMAKTPPAVTAR
jgi:hypothetical protein